MRDLSKKDKPIIIDKHGQVKVKIGDLEVRTAFDYSEPFPLYPGEALQRKEKLPVIPRNCALKLEAIRDFNSGEERHVAGDEWLEFGPKIYIPQVEAKIVETIKPITIQGNQALKVRALRETKDSKGKDRNAGEEWLIRDLGFYIPGINETVDSIVKGKIIDDTTALLLEAKQTFTDIYGVERKAGEQWLVTSADASIHIPDVYETFIESKDITVLRDDEFCYIKNPKDEKGQNQLGKKILVVGPRSFFLRPGEEIEGGI
jgi:major vault protein